MTQQINQDVSTEDLIKISDGIKELNKDFIELASEIFKIETDEKVISKPSVYIFSAINRAIALNNGFLTLTEDDNYITALNLLRIQADNTMRVFAVSLVSDRAEFFDYVLNGNHVRNFKTVDGLKMTDTFLSNELDKTFPGFKNLYQNTSGHIHFSHEHLNLNRKSNLVGDIVRNEIIINGRHNYSIAEKVDFSFNMFIVGTELYKLIRGYKFHIKEWFENQ